MVSAQPCRKRRGKRLEKSADTLAKEFVRRAFDILGDDALPRRRIDALLLLATSTPRENVAATMGFSLEDVRHLEKAAEQCGIAHALVFGRVIPPLTDETPACSTQNASQVAYDQR